MEKNKPNLTQEGRVLAKLKELEEGTWLNKQYLIREMMLTQAGRAIHNLENDPRWKAQYVGYFIEHSDFTDDYGFKSYKLTKKDTLF